MRTAPQAASPVTVDPVPVDAAIDRFQRSVEVALGPKAWGRMQSGKQLTPAQQGALLSATGALLMDLPVESYATLVPQAWWKAVGIDPTKSANRRLSDFGAQGKALAERLMRPRDVKEGGGPAPVTPLLAPLVARSASVGILIDYLSHMSEHFSADVDVTRDALGDPGVHSEVGVSFNRNIRIEAGSHQPFALVAPRPSLSLAFRTEVGVTRLTTELLSERPNERFAFGFASSLAETKLMLQGIVVVDEHGKPTRYDARLSQPFGPFLVSAGASERDHVAWFASDTELVLGDHESGRFSLSATLFKPLKTMDGSPTPGVTEGFVWLRLTQ
jgi:hypothetical protein